MSGYAEQSDEQLQNPAEGTMECAELTPSNDVNRSKKSSLQSSRSESSHLKASTSKLDAFNQKEARPEKKPEVGSSRHSNNLRKIAKPKLRTSGSESSIVKSPKKKEDLKRSLKNPTKSAENSPQKKFRMFRPWKDPSPETLSEVPLLDIDSMPKHTPCADCEATAKALAKWHLKRGTEQGKRISGIEKVCRNKEETLRRYEEQYELSFITRNRLEVENPQFAKMSHDEVITNLLDTIADMRNSSTSNLLESAKEGETSGLTEKSKAARVHGNTHSMNRILGVSENERDEPEENQDEKPTSSGAAPTL